MKFIFVGDPHMMYNAPSKRLDDVKETFKRKLEQVFSIATATGSSFILTPGDFCNGQFNDIHSFVYFCNILNQTPVPIYSGVGNHDMLYKRYDKMETYPINAFHRLGLVTIISSLLHFPADDTYLASYNAYQHPNLEDFIAKNNVPVDKVRYFMCHHFINDFKFKDPLSIDYATIKMYFPNLQFILQGHDHRPLLPLKMDDKVTLLRPGSLFRLSASSENRERDIAVFCIDTATGEVTRHPIHFDPFDKVFNIDLKNFEAVTDQEYELSFSSEVEGLTSQQLLEGVSLEDFTVKWINGCQNPEAVSFLSQRFTALGILK